MTDTDTVTLTLADLAQQLADAEARGMVEERRRWEVRLMALLRYADANSFRDRDALLHDAIAIMEGREP